MRGCHCPRFGLLSKVLPKKQSAKQSFLLELYHKMQRMGINYKYQIFFRLPLSLLASEMIDLLIASYKFCHFFYNSLTNSLKSTCIAIESPFSNTNVIIDIFMHKTVSRVPPSFLSCNYNFSIHLKTKSKKIGNERSLSTMCVLTKASFLA